MGHSVDVDMDVRIVFCRVLVGFPNELLSKTQGKKCFLYEVVVELKIQIVCFKECIAYCLWHEMVQVYVKSVHCNVKSQYIQIDLH